MANNVRKLVHGVGINDLSYPIAKCPYYQRWRSILCRCYSPKFHIANKAYEHCEICEEWIYASNFKSWMENQDWEGNVLDKDIILPGNKVYGPTTCMFVPIEINSLFVKPNKNRKYPIGVYKSSVKNKFDVKISLNTKKIFLGCFNDVIEAHRVWQKYKIEYLKEIYTNQSNIIIKQRLLEMSKSIEIDYLNNIETKYT